jgi:hypothetical protein
MYRAPERTFLLGLTSLLSALVLAACTALGNGSAANDPSCAVYKAFYAEFDARPTVFSLPAATPHSGGIAPSVFVRDDGEVVSMDTSSYVEQLETKPTFNIADCFDAGGTRFFDGAFEALEARYPNRNEYLALWRLSPIAVAPDAQHALMYAEHYCGPPCGSGEYYLFEKEGEEWVQIGAAPDWIS